MSQRSYFRDDPDPGNDRLEREDFAKRTIGALTEIRRQSKSSVAGLIAPWGAGKSTTLEMIVKGLEQHDTDPWVVVDLNPWLYSDVESLQLGFFVSLREALPRGKKWGKKRERVGNFFTAISPMGKVNGLVGIDASSALESIGERIAGDVSANALRKKAEEVLGEVDSPILFVMDDLDRLTPDELLMVFKLVRLVGRLPNVYYLLAYDEKTLLDLIQQTSVASGNRARAREYMEKIIQVRFDVPDLRPAQKEHLTESALSEILATYSIDLTRDEEESFGVAYRDCLRHYLTTPRSINRYFAQVDAFYDSLNREVKFVDFALVTFIRTFEPGVYKNLTGVWRDELLGESAEFIFGRKKETVSEREDRWQAMLAEAHVATANIPGVHKVLLSLFPRLQGDGASQAGSGVGNRDYFDRYFSFGVPGDDISDVAMRQMVDAINETSDATSLNVVRAALMSDTKRTCRKLFRLLAGKSNASVSLLPVLAEVYAETDYEFFTIDGNARVLIEELARISMAETAANRIEEAVNLTGNLPHGAILLSTVLSRDVDREASINPEFQSCTAEILERRIIDLLSRPLEDISTHDFRHVYHWRLTAGKEATDSRLKQALIDGEWSTLDFAARSVSVATSGRSEWLSDVQFDLLEEVIGLDHFFDALQSQMGTDGPLPLRHHYEDTIENRRLVALGQLKQRRDRDRL
ncbi:KAP family NTPase [Streptomyces sp. NBC_01558]|uniref:KAP family P-loop NTPase fold protein n=1 Tax=Streptomyces sp. NBC_01558 TaxID=2975878 RepID=UPI002DD85081|nr:P-loop NTPase fold protein [Streptomyces sp. NBC_01558]WSD78987.1 KAP family NTPase [Streptomyces sp. NBC_01558]